MARLSNDQRLSNLHADALRQFNDIQTALRDERLQCLQDRRFYSLCGAQWEGPAPSDEFACCGHAVIRRSSTLGTDGTRWPDSTQSIEHGSSSMGV